MRIPNIIYIHDIKSTRRMDRAVIEIIFPTPWEWECWIHFNCGANHENWASTTLTLSYHIFLSICKTNFSYYLDNLSLSASIHGIVIARVSVPKISLSQDRREKFASRFAKIAFVNYEILELNLLGGTK